MASRSYSKGDVIFMEVPYSNLMNTVDRPVFIISNIPGDDYIVCQITKELRTAPGITQIDYYDFITGRLRIKSYVRVDKIFALEKSLISNYVGKLNPRKTTEIINNLKNVIDNY
jgi:mRNA interferase MazF